MSVLQNQALVGGYLAGRPIETIVVGYYEGRRLQYDGKVRGGLTWLVRAQLTDCSAIRARVRGELKIVGMTDARIPWLLATTGKPHAGRVERSERFGGGSAPVLWSSVALVAVARSHLGLCLAAVNDCWRAPTSTLSLNWPSSLI